MKEVTKVDVFLSVDEQTIDNYFNAHDPAPLYKRQLSYRFEDYIMTSVTTAKRHTVIGYKLKCKNEIDKQYAEPLTYAIRRHFSVKKTFEESEFEKFKRRNYKLLFVSLVIVMLCQGVLPLLISNNGMHSLLSNSLDVFSWVVLWQPIDQLIFHWNPHLKDISILDRLSRAEVIVVGDEK
jgi:hypothetical protein